MGKRIIVFVFAVALYVSCAPTVFAPTPIGDVVERMERELLYVYDGSLYHAVARQCDNTPLITGSGFRIDPDSASFQRVIAVSPDLLDDPYRRRLGIERGFITDTVNDRRFLGKLKYGDIIWIESPRDSLGNYIYPNLNGPWRVEDAKNPRFRNSDIKFDFLQTVGDRELYNDDRYWSGRFEGVKMYKNPPYHETT